MMFLILFCAILILMGLFNWGALPKAQDDPQTINEAITEAIASHESDPTAHLGAGESLEQHKSNEVIDHPEQSLVPDKIDSSWSHFFSDVASVDGFFTEGYAFSEFPGARLYVVDGEQAISKVFSTMDLLAGRGILTSDFVLNFMARATENNSSFRWSFGFYTGQAGLGAWNSGNGVRFRFEGSNLYAEAKSTSQTLTTQITGVDITALHSYRIFYNSTDAKIYFYIDGLLKASLDIPTSFPATPIYFLVQNQGQGSGYDVSFYFSALDFSYAL